jgi:ParB family transcriptional regulator, chromosome partitioning protein
MKIGEYEGVVSRKEIFMVDPNKIIIKKGWNPRFDFTGQEDLVLDVTENGVRFPVTVKGTNDNELILLDGERRLRAVLEANKQGAEIKTIPAFIKTSTTSDSEALFWGVVANHGKPLLPIEEAEAFRRFLNWGHSIKEIAKRLGRSIPFVNNRLLLLDGSKEVQEAINRKELPVGLAKKIIEETGGDQELQKDLVDEVKKGKEGKEVVKELLIENRSKTSKDRIFDLVLKVKKALESIEDLEIVFVNTEIEEKGKIKDSIKDLETVIELLLQKGI